MVISRMLSIGVQIFSEVYLKFIRQLVVDLKSSVFCYNTKTGK